MTRKSLLIAATLALTAAGSVAANAASFGNVGGSAPSQSMIQHVHEGYGPHPHPHGPRWGQNWGPNKWGGPGRRCMMVRHECSDYFRPGSFRWERCVARRGC